jgi:preprotein translocase subunit SecB
VNAAGQLESVWLSRVTFRENLEFDPDDANACRYSLRRSAEIDSVAEDMWVLHMDVEVEWTRSDDGEELPFDLGLQVSGAFSWEQAPVDPSFVHGWLDFNGPYLLWPYLRSHIATVTNLSSLPPLTIYTMTVPRPRSIEAPEGQMRLDPVRDPSESQ